MGDDMTSGFHIESSELVHEGPIVSTERVAVRTPDGSVVDRQVVRHPGAVGVVAVHEGHVVLVEQYRAPIDALLVEIPAGRLDVDGEPLETAARRELVEEVGLEAGRLVELGSFLTAAGFTDELLTLFAALDCTEVGQQVDGIEEAHMTIVRVPVDDILDWAVDGRLRDSKTVIGLFWAHARGLLEP